MTDEQMAEIEERTVAAVKANADEWELSPAGWEGIGYMLSHKTEGWNVAWFWSDWDEPDMQAFIELFRHSRQDVTSLVAEVRRLKGRVAELEHRSNEWQHDCANWANRAMKAEDRVAALERDVQWYKFAPLGDNHHNAALCPYCNPTGAGVEG